MNNGTSQMRNLPQCLLDEVVERIVAVSQPERIILFGSAARGEMGPHSDLDVLVIKAGAHRRETTDRIMRALYGVDASIDVVVATPQDIERYKDSHALVYKPALREGVVLYEAHERFPPATRGSG